MLKRMLCLVMERDVHRGERMWKDSVSSQAKSCKGHLQSMNNVFPPVSGVEFADGLTAPREERNT